jgi:Helix-turn-helix domain
MTGGVNLQLDSATLIPLIRQIVTETVALLDAERAKLSEKLAYSEEEAARLLDLEPWQLRDERRRGRIRASQIVGRRIRYFRDDLIQYLRSREYKPEADGRQHAR